MSDSKDPLGDRIKALEAQWSGPIVPRHLAFSVRLDGHGFSKLTRGLRKPCDERFISAMVEATENILDRFVARTAFVESDEITFVFPACNLDVEGSCHMFGGRTSKIVSLMAAAFSVEFSKCLPEEVSKGRLWYFDARVMVGEVSEIRDTVWWRFNNDTFKNGVSMIAQTLFSSKELHGVGTKSRMEMIGPDLSGYPEHLLYGTLVKKELFEKALEDGKSVTRGRVVARSGKVLKGLTMDEVTDLVFAKYWPA